MAKRTWVKVVESASTDAAVYDYPTRSEGENAARDMLGGCILGQGYVEVWGVDPASDEARAHGEPLRTLRA